MFSSKIKPFKIHVFHSNNCQNCVLKFENLLHFLAVAGISTRWAPYFAREPARDVGNFWAPKYLWPRISKIFMPFESSHHGHSKSLYKSKISCTVSVLQAQKRFKWCLFAFTRIKTDPRVRKFLFWCLIGGLSLLYEMICLYRKKLYLGAV